MMMMNWGYRLESELYMLLRDVGGQSECARGRGSKGKKGPGIVRPLSQRAVGER